MSADHRARSCTAPTASTVSPRAHRPASQRAGAAACALLAGVLLAGCGAQAPPLAPQAAESGESTSRSSTSRDAEPTTTASRPPTGSAEVSPEGPTAGQAEPGQTAPGEAVPGETNPRQTAPRYTPPPSLPAPYIAQTWWEDTPYGTTLKIEPTTAGRQTTGYDDGLTAWQEVRQHEPGADTPGMREQFLCHWDWARLVEPDKPTWNIEPWRPVVGDGEMILTQCNPGGPEV